jgi:uncharacterized membrane protein YedE/YeeE
LVGAVIGAGVGGIVGYAADPHPLFGISMAPTFAAAGFVIGGLAVGLVLLVLGVRPFLSGKGRGTRRDCLAEGFYLR